MPGRSPPRCEALIRDSARDDAAHVDAARQIIALRTDDAALAVDLVKSIAPDMPDDLSVGFLQAVSLSEAKEVGPALVGLAPTLPSVPRAAAVKTLLARAAWVEALLAAAEAGQFDLGSLALDQKQRLAAHADDKIAERARSSWPAAEACQMPIASRSLPSCRRKC